MKKEEITERYQTDLNHFIKKHGNNMDCFDGSKINPRKFTERYSAWHLQENYCRFI